MGSFGTVSVGFFLSVMYLGGGQVASPSRRRSSSLVFDDHLAGIFVMGRQQVALGKNVFGAYVFAAAMFQ